MKKHARMSRRAWAAMAALAAAVAAPAQDANRNYLRTRTYTNASASSWRDNVTFVDSLGRMEETVAVGASPSGGSLATWTTYDAHGRKAGEWLPFVSQQQGAGHYVAPADVEALSSSSYGSNAGAHTVINHEPSPLGRESEIYGPGKPWHDGGKAMVMEYFLNSDGGDTLSCKKFTIVYGSAYNSANGRFEPSATISCSGFHAAGTLAVTRTCGENGEVSFEFVDRNGVVILSRKMLGGAMADTYYVRDPWGNLLAVLPPGASSRMGTGQWSSDGPVVAGHAYLYVYDNHYRLSWGKLPGCGWSQTIYDKSDEPIFSQDAVQAAKGEWTYRLPDAWGRECEVGVCHNTIIRNITSAVMPNLTSAGYEPTGITLVSASPLVENFYDRYDNIPFAVPQSQCQQGDGLPVAASAKGRLVASRMSLSGNVASTPDVKKVAWYDYMGRLVETWGTNILGGEDTWHGAYDFTGNVTRERTTHTASGKTPVSTTTVRSYDNWGRPAAVTHSTNGSTPVALASYTYDALGRVASKTAGGVETTTYKYNVRSWPTEAGGPRLTERLLYNQDTDSLWPGREHEYRWDGKIAAYGVKAGGETEMRGFRLIYDGLGRLTEAHYGEGPALDRNYLIYDEKVDYDLMGNPTWIYRMGQRGDGNCVPIDDVTLEYEGNRVVKTTDDGYVPTWSGAFDFVDIEDEPVEYEYDQNGNMTKDLDRDILEIEYDYLNLPTMITFQDGSLARYYHTATGEKLRVDHGIRMAPVLGPTTQGVIPVSGVEGTGTRDLIPGGGGSIADLMEQTRVDYCGGVIYDRGVRKVLTDEGYVTFSSSGAPQYHYFLRDHLGNVRVVMAQDGTVEQKTHYYPFGGIMYGSTGQGVQPYKYGGKELDRTNGLDSYDFGARSYFADRLQWMTMDPLCEKYYDTSPYAYCKNDPVNMIDLDGRDEWQFNSQGILVKHIKTEEYDSFFIVDDDGKKIDEKNLILGYGTVVSFSQRETKDKEKYDIFELTGSPQTKDLFTFLADNTSVEWNLATGGWIASGTYNDYITTSHSKGNEIGIVSLIENQLSKGYYLLHLYHNHTNGSAFPSGLGYNVYDGFEMGDKQHAGWVSSIFGDDVRFSIYVPNKKQFVSYGPNSTIADFPEFWDFHSKK